MFVVYFVYIDEKGSSACK